MASSVFALLALAVLGRSSTIADVGDHIVALLTGSNFDAREAAQLLATRLELLSALTSSGDDAGLVEAFAASSHLGPSIRARLEGAGLGSLLEKREC